jgi:hypothetical protein
MGGRSGSMTQAARSRTLASQSGTTIKVRGIGGSNPVRPLLSAESVVIAMTWLLSSRLDSPRP